MNLNALGIQNHHQSARSMLVVIIFVVALIPRLWIAAQPITTLLDKVLPDDAYYYFLTAENILANKGPSVDGINNSNGWHPLWMVINVGIFALPFQNIDDPVRFTLMVSAILDASVAVILFLGMRRYIHEMAALVGAGLYAVNNMPIFQSINGLETALSAFFIALSWFFTLRLIEQPSRQRAAIWGGIFGLCFLSRTDTAIILACLGLFTIIQLKGINRWRLTFVGGVIAVIVIAPWLIWNQANFGSAFIQVSSIAVPWAVRSRFEIANPGVPIWQLSMNVISNLAWWMRGDYLGAPILIGLILWPAGIWGMWRIRKSEQARPLLMMSIPLLASGLILIGIHTLIRWYPRPWYFVVMAQILSISIGLLWASLPSGRVRVVGLALGLVGTCVFGFLGWGVGYYPWQTQYMYEAAVWIRDHTQPEMRVASMNSGIIGYYSGRSTINLDGVVNPQAFEASQQNRLMAYVREQKVMYFLDFDHHVKNEYGPFMGPDYLSALTEVQQIGSQPYEELGAYRIYSVKP